MRHILASAIVAMTALTGVVATTQSAFAFGAIAVDDEDGVRPEEVGYGIGAGNSRAEAEKNALRECKKAGNKGCEVAVWYESCGAYAASKGYSGIGYGKSKAVAEQQALANCNNRSCKIVVSDCDE